MLCAEPVSTAASMGWEKTMLPELELLFRLPCAQHAVGSMSHRQPCGLEGLRFHPYTWRYNWSLLLQVNF